MSAIGLDLGTSRVKAVRFDRAWRPVDTEAEATTIRVSADGRSEQDMDQVWAAARRVLGAVSSRTRGGVDLVALTAQGDGCWLVDAHGDPVRPAILWNDNRSASFVEGWQDDGTLERAFRISGCYGAPGLAHGQLRWLAEHEPDIVAHASRLLSCGSWIYQQLTGRQVLEASDAANPFLDARTRCYDDTLLDRFGLTALRRLLPELVTGPDRAAPLLAGVAAELGLPAGTPVVLSPYDVPSTAIGTGVMEVGQAFAVLGTTLCVGVVSDDPQLSRPPNGMTLPGVTSDRWLIAYATMTGTEVLDWTATLLGLPGAEDLVALAATARLGAQPLLLPYLSPAGERSPFRDSTIRGSLHGLSTRHSRADIARAALDGLTLAVRDCLDAAGATSMLALSGGGARSELWCQAISDATDLPVTQPDTFEVGARGAVLSAAVDIGLLACLPDAVAHAVGPGHTYRPDPDETRRLAEAFTLLRSTRAATSGTGR